MSTPRPLEPEIAAQRGLSPAERARAIARGKQAAFHLVHAVRHRNAHQVQRVSDGLSREELAAVAIVLAEVADLLRLQVVKHAEDDGTPGGLAGLLRGAA